MLTFPSLKNCRKYHDTSPSLSYAGLAESSTLASRSSDRALAHSLPPQQQSKADLYAHGEQALCRAGSWHGCNCLTQIISVNAQVAGGLGGGRLGKITRPPEAASRSALGAAGSMRQPGELRQPAAPHSLPRGCRHGSGPRAAAASACLPPTNPLRTCLVAR